MRPWITSVLSTTIVIAFVLSAAGCGNDGAIEGDLLITADRVFDGRRSIDDGAVLIAGRRIVAVGAENALKTKADRTIALGDATVLPGIIDLHVHGLGAGMEISGVTTVRDLGSPELALPVRPARPGHVRVFAAGPLITVPRGYPIPIWGPEIAAPVLGLDHARRVVARLIGRGAGVIKISLEPGPEGRWPMLTVPEVKAIVDEAHVSGRLVTAHVSDSRGARAALEGGVDELAHIPCDRPDGPLMRTLASRHVAIVATLHVEQTTVGRSCAAGVVNARTFIEAGGRLLYGSDFGNQGIPPGIDVAELRLMSSAGLSPAEALTAATAEAGEQLRRGRLGSLAEGAPADVIAVRGDALRDLDRLENLVLVVRGGRVVIEGGRLDLPPP